MPSPTQRTLARLRELGFTARVVEHWNPYAKIRQDLFGFIDILALHPESGILGVQACAGGSHAARVSKIVELPTFVDWCQAGGRVEVWSWSKQGARGKRKVWMLRREELKP